MSDSRQQPAVGPARGSARPNPSDASANADAAPAAAATSWKVTLPCTRAEAEAIDSGEPTIDAVLMTSEEVEDDVERWRLDAYLEAEPDAATLASLRALVPSAGAAEPLIEALADADWVTMSQAGLEPIREGRFVVHTNASPAEAPAGGRAFLIDAGQAFGTGHHATTSGCLAMLDDLAGERFGNIIDLGTGTGLLAFAAQHLWPAARITATDIDPIAIEVTRDNMAVNDVADLHLLVADGARDPAIAEAAPFDLVIANILAGPLIAMAREVAGIAAPGAVVVLAGLLTRQADEVTAAYVTQRCALAGRLTRGDWTILRLTAGAADGSGDVPAGDRGGWATDGR
jgi:ribosomal protein L11 methyltransferase